MLYKTHACKYYSGHSFSVSGGFSKLALVILARDGTTTFVPETQLKHLFVGDEKITRSAPATLDCYVVTVQELENESIDID